jgi:hypothetical protein
MPHACRSRIPRLSLLLTFCHPRTDFHALPPLPSAGQHAEVICVREACPPLCRVGLRTATGLEDAVPLHALEPLLHPPRRTKAHKRRRTFTVTSSFPKPCPSTAAPTPCQPSPHPTRTPHTRRHSTDATSPQRSPIKHTHRRSSTLPSPPRVHVESSGSVTLAGSRLVPTPPPSPPPLAFPSIPSRLSRYLHTLSIVVQNRHSNGYCSS